MKDSNSSNCHIIPSSSFRSQSEAQKPGFSSSSTAGMKQKLVARNYCRQSNQKKDSSQPEQLKTQESKSQKTDLAQERKKSESKVPNNKPRLMKKKKQSRLSNDDETQVVLEEAEINMRKMFLVGTVCCLVAGVGFYYYQSAKVPKDKFKQIQVTQRRLSESYKGKTRKK
eukprot:GHVP01018411.1.p1 GENE.GHVP01018411.1~~GHVP01018411.1.p1  ORF type:complete len:170 (+),score=31.91 GHVP01018411.1:214-723(+)